MSQEERENQRCVLRFDLAQKFICAMLSSGKDVTYPAAIVSAAIELADEVLQRMDQHIAGLPEVER